MPGQVLDFLWVRLNFDLLGPTSQPIVFERDGVSISFECSLDQQRHEIITSYVLSLPDGRTFASDMGGIAAGDIVELFDLSGEEVSLPVQSISIDHSYSPVVAGSLAVELFSDSACGLAFCDSLGTRRYLGDGDSDMIIVGDVISSGTQYSFAFSPSPAQADGVQFQQDSIFAYADGSAPVLPDFVEEDGSLYLVIEGVRINSDKVPPLAIGATSPIIYD